MCPSPEQTGNASDAAAYVVEGMSCGHCKAAVTEAVVAVAGVESVAVNLETKRVDVRGSVSDDAIRAAVDDAGYETRRAA